MACNRFVIGVFKLITVTGYVFDERRPAFQRKTKSRHAAKRDG
jgi:hypothetical protein